MEIIQKENEIRFDDTDIRYDLIKNGTIIPYFIELIAHGYAIVFELRPVNSENVETHRFEEVEDVARWYLNYLQAERGIEDIIRELTDSSE